MFDSIVGRPWGAVIPKPFKTAPKIQPINRKNYVKSSCNCKNPQNSFQNQPKSRNNCEKKKLKLQKFLKQLQKPAHKSKKLREKVAETAEISKTAPKTSP